MDAHNRREDFIFFSAPLNQTCNLFAYWITPALQAASFMKLQHQVHDVFPEHRTVNPAVPQAYAGTLPQSLILQATPSNFICCCHLALQSYLNSATKVLAGVFPTAATINKQHWE